MDKIKRKSYIKYRIKVKVNDILIQSNALPLLYKYKLKYYAKLLPTNSSISKQRNRCLLTGRTYGVNTTIKLSRFPLRFLTYKSFILNYKRFSK